MFQNNMLLHSMLEQNIRDLEDEGAEEYSKS
jgi:hypothetical protein